MFWHTTERWIIQILCSEKKRKFIFVDECSQPIKLLKSYFLGSLVRKALTECVMRITFKVKLCYKADLHYSETQAWGYAHIKTYDCK